MQSVSSRIWTCVAVSMSYDDNHYTTGILLILGFFVFICRASRICSHSLSILCAIIVVFATRIFQNLDLRIEWVLRCKVHCKSSRKSCSGKTNIQFSLKTQSHKGHLNIYMKMLVLSRSSVEGEVSLEIIRLEVLNLL